MLIAVFILLNLSSAFSLSKKENELPIIAHEQAGLFGMNSPAGSGRHLDVPKTTICKVRNIKDSGDGSLRFCVESKVEPKVVVFEVSGNIELEKPITINGSYLTIAGQTAPSPGVTLFNYGLRIKRNSHDILIQHLRIRTGDTSFHDLGCKPPRKKSCTKPAIADPIVIESQYRETSPKWVPPYNIVIDHNSFSWGGDMNAQSGGNNITFINNIFSEGLANNLHVKGKHSKGLAILAHNNGISGGVNTAIVKNLFAHNWDRNPYISSGSAVIANNLLFDVQGGIMIDDHAVKKGPIRVSIIGNHIIDTPLTKRRIVLIAGYQKETRVYVSNDNLVSGEVVTDPWNHAGISKCSNWGKCTKGVPESTRAKKREDAVWPKNYSTLSINLVKDHVLNNVGAFPAERDFVDARIINDVLTHQEGIISSQRDVGGWPVVKERTRVLTVPENPSEIMKSGYTRLEEWLHGFLVSVEIGIANI